MRRHGQQGSVLALLLVVLAVIATVATAIVHTAATARSGSLLALQSARAFYAADAAVQWLHLHIARSGDCPPSPSALDPVVLGLRDFEITADCRVDTHVDGGRSVRIYYLGGTATSGAAVTADAVSRRIDVVLAQ
ncbi:hypothetical protein [Sinimarinibacterium flocculans]|uniref:hypothetical protein n=1 Tax=Sinimarinibacterium flocculans TaxID=985250 RepID=UPI0035129C4D